MNIRPGLLIIVACGLFAAPIDLGAKKETNGVDLFGAKSAVAEIWGQNRRVARRTARRTARRVERRHDYYDSLPGGCAQVGIGGVLYWRCGSIYYQPIVNDGRTVYVIVTP